MAVLITTTSNIEGKRITKYLGMVTGEASGEVQLVSDKPVAGFADAYHKVIPGVRDNALRGAMQGAEQSGVRGTFRDGFRNRVEIGTLRRQRLRSNALAAKTERHAPGVEDPNRYLGGHVRGRELGGLHRAGQARRQVDAHHRVGTGGGQGAEAFLECTRRRCCGLREHR